MKDKEQNTAVFRCRGRTDRTAMHTITVTTDVAICSCQGVDWCSHIDAVLMQGERFMVPPEDRAAADKAEKLIAPVLKAPKEWLATWRDDLVWRGKAPPRTDMHKRMRWFGKPTIIFLGNTPEMTQSEYVEHAESLGWRSIDTPDLLTTLIVSDKTGMKSKKAQRALDYDLPIINYTQWDEWCYEFTNSILDRIEYHGLDPAIQHQHAA